MDVGQKIMDVAIGIGIGVVVVVIVATILGGATVLGSATLGSFTGFTALAGLIPVVLIGMVIWLGWSHVRS